MKDSSLTLLVISDLHYSRLAKPFGLVTPYHGELARTLLRKVFLRVRHMGIQPDATVLLGDLVDNGNDPMAELDLHSIHGELVRSGIPYVAIPGNHDGDPSHFNEIFGTPPGLYPVKGYGLVAMNDVYQTESHAVKRPIEPMTELKKIRTANPDMPLIVLQHPPIYPPIDSHFPYRPVNVVPIIEAYKKLGVLVSLSGHFHKGQKARYHDEIFYHTVPSLSEAPYIFSIVKIKNGKVEVEDYPLQLSCSQLMDCHCHTEYAYCGTTVDTAAVIALQKAMGVETVCFTEHAFQLYFDKHTAMDFQWQTDPSIVEKAWDDPQRGRMVGFRNFARALRSENVKVGLEVEIYGKDGDLLLAPEDQDAGWDILVGAIHKVRGFKPGVTKQKEAEKLFMRDLEDLVGNDIQTLAHPFRFFVRQGLKRPKNLYEPVADLLNDNAVALEVNFHSYQPDPEMIRICAEKGVPIAFGSDTHDLAEAGEFWPHLQALKQAGVSSRNFSSAFFSLKK